MRELLKDRNRLLHIVDVIDIIIERCNGMTRDDLTADKLLFGGVVYHTMIIGEAVYNLTKAFCKAHPETPWQMIAKMRHNQYGTSFLSNGHFLTQVMHLEVVFCERGG